MRTVTGATILCILLSLSSFEADKALADVIRFKKGGAQRCVILEETEDEVRFLSSMGEAKMPVERIESITRESDDVNETLTAKWDKKKTRAPESEPAEPEPAKPEKPKSLRTYLTQITKRTIALGGKSSGVQGGQPVADFMVDDLGEIKGNRVFEVKIVSYRSGSRRITSGDFHVTLQNGYRIDAKPLEGYPALNLTLKAYDNGSGYLTFPTSGKLETLVLRSSIADFDLDLETGHFAVKRGPF